jgi:hypothetical protein
MRVMLVRERMGDVSKLESHMKTTLTTLVRVGFVTLSVLAQPGLERGRDQSSVLQRDQSGMEELVPQFNSDQAQILIRYGLRGARARSSPASPDIAVLTPPLTTTSSSRARSPPTLRHVARSGMALAIRPARRSRTSAPPMRSSARCSPRSHWPMRRKARAACSYRAPEKLSLTEAMKLRAS